MGSWPAAQRGKPSHFTGETHLHQSTLMDYNGLTTSMRRMSALFYYCVSSEFSSFSFIHYILIRRTVIISKTPLIKSHCLTNGCANLLHSFSFYFTRNSENLIWILRKTKCTSSNKYSQITQEKSVLSTLLVKINYTSS